MPYAFTAPDVKPETKCLMLRKKRMNNGTDAITNPAKRGPHAERPA
jgi:hypothetical protein